MIRVLVGDMFESQAQTLVNTVNTVGVMGKGVALQFKKRFPDMYEDYVQRCRRGEVRLGQPYLYRRLIPPWVVNFPTKDHWRSVARLDDITRGLEYLLRHCREWGITSLAVPPLGCGEGQLEWGIVGPTLYRYLARLDVPVELYAPYGTPLEQTQAEFLERTSVRVAEGSPGSEAQRVQPAWVALVEILHRIEEQPYHWPVGRTTFQKIAYVATEEGLPTGLQYEKGSYGPFAAGLRPLATRLVNNGLIVEDRLGRMFAVRVGPTFADARGLYSRHLDRWEDIIERVTDLFMRMDGRQAEVTATVLYAARRLASGGAERPTELEVLAEVMRWKQRRRPLLSEETVASAIRDLASLGWVEVSASEDLPLPEEVGGV